jgi:hypothetical protein
MQKWYANPQESSEIQIFVSAPAEAAAARHLCFSKRDKRDKNRCIFADCGWKFV